MKAGEEWQVKHIKICVAVEDLSSTEAENCAWRLESILDDATPSGSFFHEENLRGGFASEPK